MLSFPINNFQRDDTFTEIHLVEEPRFIFVD